jgi:hypothetical protein
VAIGVVCRSAAKFLYEVCRQLSARQITEIIGSPWHGITDSLRKILRRFKSRNAFLGGPIEHSQKDVDWEKFGVFSLLCNGD